MPVSEDQLRQLLTERSDPARNRPVPQERITARIRRARMKRAAGAGLLAVAVAAGVFSGVTLAHERTSGHGASLSGQPLPASFTASDGTAYRQLAATTLTDPAQRSAALTVTAGSDPVDVMAACDTPTSGLFIEVKVNDNGTPAGLLACKQTPQLMSLRVRPGQVAHVTFVRESNAGVQDRNVGWRLAAYAWTPPATIRPAPATPRVPQSYTGPNSLAGPRNVLRKLVASRSGDWPGDRTATITFTYRSGRNFNLSMVCAGPIGGRLQLSLQVNGSPGPALSCTPAGPGQLGGPNVTGRRNGESITLTFHIQAPSWQPADYAKRAASWTIALYEEQS
jgi:hypothetical protein